MNIAIVQARMASKRLPGKALAKLGAVPLIHHVLERGKKIRGIHEVVLATSRGAENDPLEAYARSLGVDVFRGDEDDVIERFYRISQPRGVRNLIRLTGDNPFVDFHALSFLLEKHLAEQADYTCLTGYPVGTLGDIFSFRALEESHRHADGKELSDHVDLYVLENQDKFRVVRFRLEETLSKFRLTVDDEADLARARRLVEAEPQGILGMDTTALLALIDRLGVREEMQPAVTNTSPQNVYTGELVQQIKRCETVRIRDITAR